MSKKKELELNKDVLRIGLIQYKDVVNHYYKKYIKAEYEYKKCISYKYDEETNSIGIVFLGDSSIMKKRYEDAKERFEKELKYYSELILNNGIPKTIADTLSIKYKYINNYNGGNTTL